MLIDYAFDLTVRHTSNLFLICSTDNVKARRFYERLGFRQAGLLDNLVVPGHDEILYRKSAGTMRQRD
jgi:RimJ/RimL family protein N-acetyltransferase